MIPPNTAINNLNKAIALIAISNAKPKIIVIKKGILPSIPMPI